MCVPDGIEFTCDCSGTNYTGETCNIEVILLPTIPPLTKGQTHDITISRSIVSRQLKIRLFEDGSNPLRFEPALKEGFREISFYYTPITTGTHTITHRHNAGFEVQPSKVIVLVRETSERSTPNNHYFTTLGLRVGQLKEGCCHEQNQLTFSCPGSIEQVTLKAACQWKNDGTTHWAPGVIFADGHNLSLPVSVAGYQYSQDGEGSVLSATSECTPCNSTQPVCKQETPMNENCYCYNFTGEDAQDFLNTHALGLTYIEQIQNLLPKWLKVQDNLINTTTHSEYDYLAPIVQSHVDVQGVEGCSKITPMKQGIYSILRYDKTLSGEIDGQTYTYDGRSDTRGSSDPMCFAVNLCQGLNSPVFFQLSQPVHNILVSDYLKDFVEKGWHIQLNTVTVSKFDMNNTTDQTYVWNGLRMILPPQITSDISVNTNTEAWFQSENLSVQVAFTGDATFQYQVSAHNSGAAFVQKTALCFLADKKRHSQRRDNVKYSK